MKRNFLTGLVIVLPIALTIIIVMLIVDLLTQPFLGFAEKLLLKTPLMNTSNPLISSNEAIKIWSQSLILVGIFLIILILGLFARWFLFNYFVKLGDKIIHRIPIINKLYKTVKEVINVMFTPQGKAFKQVVMVAFPNSSTLCVGFLSRESPPVFNNPTKQNLVSVFLPTTPNPTTGYLLQFPIKEVTPIEMSVEDALKFIVSCGMVTEKINQIGPNSQPSKEI
ncbi:MAG: hypothetical protein S4CHLAM6_13290 [Chlamydiae bacterium]|nr:hypothetical protein [Chlamydiota bacterium]